MAKKNMLITIAIAFVVILPCIYVLGYWNDWGDGTFRVKSSQVNNINNDLNTKGFNIKNVKVDQETGIVYVDNQLIVVSKLDSKIEKISEIAEKNGAKIVGCIGEIGFYQFEFNKSMKIGDLNKAIDELMTYDCVEEVFINSIFQEKNNSISYPSDPWSHDGKNALWNQDEPDDNNWGIEAIKAPSAWSLVDFVNKSPVKVGVIDTSIDMNHEDLKVSKVIGAKTNEKYHGTHVAGTIGATNNNKKGITGVSPNVNIYSYAIENQMNCRFGLLLALATFIIEDVKVINFSYGYIDELVFAADRGNQNALTIIKTDNDFLESGLKRFIEVGYEFVICVSAGNKNEIEFVNNPEADFGYEKRGLNIFKKAELGNVDALYNGYFTMIEDESVKNRIIVVGSIGLDKKESNKYFYSKFSNIGSRVDVVAPGENILSTIPSSILNFNKKYEQESGTSMATPHVSGVASMIFACNEDIPGDKVKEIILSTTTESFSYTDGSCGLLNAQAAVEKALEYKEVFSTCKFGDLKCLIGFGFGDSLDENKVVSNGAFHKGNITYVLKDGKAKNISLFFDQFQPAKPLIAVSANSGDFFSIKINEHTFNDVNGILGQPTSFSESNDYDFRPQAYYSFDDGTELYLTGNMQNNIITEVTYKISSVASFQKNQPEQQWIVTDSDGVNLRSGPGINYSVIGKVSANTIVTVSETFASGGYEWGKIKSKGVEGWIALNYAERL